MSWFLCFVTQTWQTCVSDTFFWCTLCFRGLGVFPVFHLFFTSLFQRLGCASPVFWFFCFFLSSSSLFFLPLFPPLVFRHSDLANLCVSHVLLVHSLFQRLGRVPMFSSSCHILVSEAWMCHTCFLVFCSFFLSFFYFYFFPSSSSFSPISHTSLLVSFLTSFS